MFLHCELLSEYRILRLSLGFHETERKKRRTPSTSNALDKRCQKLLQLNYIKLR